MAGQAVSRPLALARELVGGGVQPPSLFRFRVERSVQANAGCVTQKGKPPPFFSSAAPLFQSLLNLIRPARTITKKVPAFFFLFSSAPACRLLVLPHPLSDSARVPSAARRVAMGNCWGAKISSDSPSRGASSPSGLSLLFWIASFN